MGVAYTPGASLHAGSLTMTGYTSGTPGTLDDIYTADKAGDLELWNYVYTGTHASGSAPSRQPQISDERDIHLYAYAVGHTATGYLNIQGTDKHGNAVEELVTILTTNNSVASAKQTAYRFATITSPGTGLLSLSTGGSPGNCTFYLIQKQWGVVHKIDNSDGSHPDTSFFRFECPVLFGDGTTETHFKDVRKSVYFYDRYQVKNNAYLTWGETGTVGGETIYHHGCRVVIARESTALTYFHVLSGGTERIYDSHLYIEPLSWGIQSGADVEVYNSTIAGEIHSNTSSRIKHAAVAKYERCNIHDVSYLEFAASPDISDIFSYGNDRNVQANASIVWLFSSKIIAPNSYDAYAYKDVAGYPGLFHIVNTDVDPTKCHLDNATNYIWIHYSISLNIANDSGTAIQNARVSLADKTNAWEWMCIDRSGQTLNGGQAYNTTSFTLDSVTGLAVDDYMRIERTIFQITGIASMVVSIHSSNRRYTPLADDRAGDNDYSDEEQVYHYTPLDSDASGDVACTGKNSPYIMWTNSTDTPLALDDWMDYNPFILRIAKYGYKPYRAEREISRFIDEGVVLEVNSFLTADETTAATYGSSLTINHTTQKITVTGNLSINNIYDYCQLELFTNARLHIDDFFYTVDGINFFSEYEFEVSDGVTVTATEKKLTVNHANGYNLNTSGGFTGVLMDDTNVRVPVTLTNLVDGSTYYLAKTDGTEILKGVVSGTSVSGYFEHLIAGESYIDVIIRARLAPVGVGTDYIPYSSESQIGDTAWSYKIEQQEDPISNTN